VPTPGRRPNLFCLSDRARRRLRSRARSRRRPHDEVRRANVLLQLASRQLPSVVARRTGVSSRTVTRLRGRFEKEGMKALKDRPRSGRPLTIGPVARCEVIAMACGLPGEFGVTSHTVWTFDALQQAFAEKRPNEVMSRSSPS
jgi:transposase